MKIVIAPDSFKGSLTAKQVADAIETGIKKVDQDIEIIKVPVADGGEGTVEAILTSVGGEIIEATVKDPLLNDITASYGILKDEQTAVIEMAAASGLVLVPNSKRNPWFTTTYGTGQLFVDALDRGCRKFIVGLGGSATNDGGSGFLKALGVHFLDIDGNDTGYGGQSLVPIHTIDISKLDKRIQECEIIVACDVTNPLCGPHGASAVYGPQKGADPEMVNTLDKALYAYGKLLEKAFGIPVLEVPGSGAAGGFGAALISLGAKLNPGIDIITKVAELEKKLIGADLVITGEGSIDFQTAFGKTPSGVAELANKFNIPVIALTGNIGERVEELYDKGFDSIFAICDGPMSLDESMSKAEKLLIETSERIIRLIKVYKNN
ncbi:MAG: glycerate kinase [Syntrophomonadaceae bacterium]|nr:glycerate kinase [Syntrophomonadaceae bacterium]